MQEVCYAFCIACNHCRMPQLTLLVENYYYLFDVVFCNLLNTTDFGIAAPLLKTLLYKRSAAYSNYLCELIAHVAGIREDFSPLPICIGRAFL